MPDDGSEDPAYVKGWNDAVAVMRAQKPFGWFYELPSQAEYSVEVPGRIYLGCTGPDAERVARQSQDEGEGPVFPLYAGKEGVPLSTMPDLQAAVKAGLEDGSIQITGAA